MLLIATLFQDAKKRWERQSRAFYNLFRQSDRVEKVAQIIERLVCASFANIILLCIGVICTCALDESLYD